MTNALYFLIESLRTIITFVFVARFLLQACRADFYNPISQGIVKVTDPVLKPLRAVLPGYRNLDFAAFAGALLTQILFVYLLVAISGAYAGGPVWIVASALLNVLMFCISVFFWSIIIIIIASFLAPGNYHPALARIDVHVYIVGNNLRARVPLLCGVGRLVVGGPGLTGGVEGFDHLLQG